MSATPASTPAVEYGALTLGRRLGQGGQGTVHEVTNKKINKSVGGGWEVAYKEYSATVLSELDAVALAAQVDLPRTLNAADSRWLCDRTAWPAAVVRRNGTTCGLLMRLVPDRFQFTLRSLAGPSAGDRRLANLEYLLNDDAYVAGIGLAVSERDRVLLLADLASTLDRLHRIGIAVGDLSPKNLLFTTDPSPECFLIDCDAMRLHGATVLPQAETPDWQVAAGEEKATRFSDSHKFALLAVRLFARDQTSTDLAALAALSPQLAGLARAGLGRDPARRPTPAVWAEQLTAAAPSASPTPPKPPHPGKRRPKPRGPARGTTSRTSHTGPSAQSPTPAKVTALNVTQGRVVALVAALIAVVVFLGVGASNGDDPSPVDPDSSSRIEESASHPWAPEPDDLSDVYSATPEDPADEYPADEETETPSAAPDPVGEADIGSCFFDEGAGTDADLVETDCTAGAFEVVDIQHDTTDLDSCDDVADSDMSVSSATHDLVLCLSYHSPGGGAYHAEQGDCVYGADGSGSWDTESCETGNFKVLAVYSGSDESKCDTWPHYNYWKRVSGPADADRDVLLCLSMNYPDAAGYAELRQCLLKSGTGDGMSFTNTGSCSSSNVVVTGRTGSYRAASFCGDNGWTTWKNPDFPELAYTVCFRRR